MDEHNELCVKLRAAGMALFRREGLRFTMQQAAEAIHISKKTIYTVYPSKEALLLDMVDDAFAHIHARKQSIIDGPGTLTDKLRAVIIALPEEYTALDLQQMTGTPPSPPVCGSIWKTAGNRRWPCWNRAWSKVCCAECRCRFYSG